MRAFYQTTDGIIRSTFFNGVEWTVDPTVIASDASYETRIAAFRDLDATRVRVILPSQVSSSYSGCLFHSNS